MSVTDAAAEIAAYLDDVAAPYVIIGGAAVQYWGEPRTTRDVDIMVMVSPERVDEFLKDAVLRFPPRISDAVEFAQENRVLLIRASDGTPLDVSIGLPGYEEEVIRRAVEVSFAGRPVRVASAEDLIIHKCLAGRPRDMEDVERVLVHQKLKLDLDYVRRWLSDFAPAVEDHDVLSVFEQAVEKARAGLGS